MHRRRHHCEWHLAGILCLVALTLGASARAGDDPPATDAPAAAPADTPPAATPDAPAVAPADAPPGTPTDGPGDLPPIPEEPEEAQDREKIRLSLSLEDAVRTAVENNLEIQSERYTVSISRRNVIVQKSVFDPFFNVAFTHAKNREPSVSQLDFDPLNPIFGVAVNPFSSTSLRTSLRGTSILGTTYSVTAAEGRFDSEEASLFALNPRYTSRLEATLVQPLLKGGWYDYNSAGIRVARNSFRISEAQMRQVLQDTIYNVISAYWDLVFTHENYLSKLNALRVAREQLRISNRRLEAGQIARVDVITPETQVARRKTEFDNAITLRDNARDNLLVVMNFTGRDSLRKLWQMNDARSPFDNLLIEPADMPVTEPLTPERNVSLGSAFERRPEYLIAQLDIDNQDIQVDVTRNELLPTLNVSGTWAQLGLERDVNNSLDELESGRFYDWVVGVNLEIPLNYRGPLGIFHSAQDEYERRILRRQSVENAIVVEVDQAIRDLKTSFRASQNLHEEVVLQRSLLDAEKERLRVGKSIAYTVSQIENDLVDRLAQEIRATTNYEKFKAAYLRAIGTLLDEYDVRFED